MPTKSTPDPVIQTLIDGSQITVDTTKMGENQVTGQSRAEIAPQSESETVGTSGDQVHDSSDFGTDGGEIDVESLRDLEVQRDPFAERNSNVDPNVTRPI